VSVNGLFFSGRSCELSRLLEAKTGSVFVNGLFFGGSAFCKLVGSFKAKTGSVSVEGLSFGDRSSKCVSANSWSKPYPDDVWGYSGSTVDDTGFGLGSCITFVDSWSGPSDAELNDRREGRLNGACLPVDNAGFVACAGSASTAFNHLGWRTGGAEPDDAGASDGLKYSSTTLSKFEPHTAEGAIDNRDERNGFVSGFGLAIDIGNTWFGAGACTTFVDPGLGPGGAEPDDAGASDDLTGFLHGLKYSGTLSNSEPHSGGDNAEGVIDDTGLNAGACTLFRLFFDPWLGPGSSAADDAGASDDLTGFLHGLKNSGILSNSEPHSGGRSDESSVADARIDPGA
jgi:hypothetical protein